MDFGLVLRCPMSSEAPDIVDVERFVGRLWLMEGLQMRISWRSIWGYLTPHRYAVGLKFDFQRWGYGIKNETRANCRAEVYLVSFALL